MNGYNTNIKTLGIEKNMKVLKKISLPKLKLFQQKSNLGKLVRHLNNKLATKQNFQRGNKAGNLKADTK